MLYFAHGINAEAAGAMIKDGKAVKWGYGGGSTPVDIPWLELANEKAVQMAVSGNGSDPWFLLLENGTIKVGSEIISG